MTTNPELWPGIADQLRATVRHALTQIDPHVARMVQHVVDQAVEDVATAVAQLITAELQLTAGTRVAWGVLDVGRVVPMPDERTARRSASLRDVPVVFRFDTGWLDPAAVKWPAIVEPLAVALDVGGGAPATDPDLGCDPDTLAVDWPCAALAAAAVALALADRWVWRGVRRAYPWPEDVYERGAR